MTCDRLVGWKWWLEAVLGFFYPATCQICREEPATARGGYVGSACRGRPDGVRWIEAPFCERCGLPYAGAITREFECANCRDLGLRFRSARAAVVATPLVLDVVHRYKYLDSIWFEPFLVELFLSRAAPQLVGGPWDMIVPVPLHPVRRRERGFNQAERLGRALSRATRLPLNARALRRVEYTQTQTVLNRSERRRNTDRAFIARTPADVESRRIVLVDDILTTGATSDACATALLDAGAAEVCVWTMARGL